MATIEAIAIRRAAALAQLRDATAAVAARFGLASPTLEGRSPDPDIRRCEELEELALFLGQVEAAPLVDAETSGEDEQEEPPSTTRKPRAPKVTP